MRRIVMFNRVTPDGAFAAADGALDWVVPEPAIDAEATASMRATGTVLFGRRTYDMFASFWPTVLADPGAATNPHDPGRRSPELLRMAEWLDAATKIVFSRTRTSAGWNNAHIAGALDPEYVRALKRAPGDDIMLFGSGSIVSALTAHGLIAEYHFILTPLLLGTGRPLFTNVPEATRLALRACTPYPSGNVALRYEVVR